MEKGKVLIFRGGWDGHEPKQVSARFARIMEKHGYSCRIYDDQEALKDPDLRDTSHSLCFRGILWRIVR